MPNTAQQLILQFGGNADEANEVIKDLVSNLGDVASTLKDMQQGSLDFGTSVSDGVQVMADSVKRSTDDASTQVQGFWQTLTESGKAAITDLGTSVQGFGDTVQNFLDAPLHTAGESIKGLLEDLGPFGAGLLAISGAAIAVGAAIIDLGSEAAATGESLRDFSVMTSQSVEETERLKAIADIGGSSLDQMRAFAFTLQRQLQATGETQEKMNRGLQDLNISAEDFRNAKLTDQILMLSKGLNEGANSGNNMTASVEVLGMRGRQYLPFLSKDLADVAKSADEVALKMSKDDIEASEKYEEGTRRLSEEFSKLKTELGLAFLPIMKDVVEVFNAGVTAFEHGKAGLEKLGVSVSGFIPYWRELAGVIKEVNGLLSAFSDDTPKAPGAPKLAMAAMPGAMHLSDAELKTLDENFKAQIKDQQDAAKAALVARDAYDELQASTGGYNYVLQHLNGSIVEAITWELQHGASVSQVVKVYGVLPAYVEQVKKQLDFEKTVAEDTTKAHLNLIATMPGLVSGGEAIANVLQGLTEDGLLPASSTTDKFNKHLLKLSDIGRDASGTMRGLRGSIDEFGKALGEITDDLVKLGQVSGGTFGGMVQSLAKIVASVNTVHNGLKKMQDPNGDTGSKVAGGVEAATGFLAATDQGDQGSDILGGVGSGAEMGATIGSVIPGIGTVIGGVVGGVVGGIVGAVRGSGPSKSEKQSRSDRDDFMAAYGGTSAVGIQNLANALTKVGVSAETARQYISTMLDAKTPQAFAAAMAQVQSALDGPAKAQASLNDSLSRYHFTIEQLGPALQRQNLDQQSQQLYKDWKTLTAAGIDVSAVTQQMSADVSAYIQNAVRTGVEVPAAMKPMLDQMIKNGELLDENGNKITDLGASGVTFSETMTQGFKDVVASVKDLTNTLRQSLGLAIDETTDKINKVPKTISVAVDYTDGGPPTYSPDGAATGGFVMSGGILHFGGGGRVPLPAAFRARGTDTVPAMLTPGEIILNAAQQSNVVGALGGQVHIHNDFSGSFIRDHAAMQELGDIMVEALSEHARSILTIGLRR